MCECVYVCVSVCVRVCEKDCVCVRVCTCVCACVRGCVGALIYIYRHLARMSDIALTCCSVCMRERERQNESV